MEEENIIQPIPQAFRKNTKIEKERQKEREKTTRSHARERKKENVQIKQNNKR